MQLTEESQKILQSNPYKKELQEVVDYTAHLLEDKQIYPTDLQWTILINHLSEMVIREKEKRAILEVDPAMFSEVSEEAMLISQLVVKKVGELPKDEIYVLSIHFESAKQNEEEAK
ncbi:PRD domain-containing protein [Enterococcus pallens]|uniref:PRD domain-containing protein n=1 Tax=Enterococcus pallens ATCC BAA-351 TaxID=1158607 RepID=R2PSY8_9ENTE|nr:PRD domain-containing protein [Enterococcus pallens]EOH87687.1 PRD domain-containing protein [Enterococcus pallens ATCC BAA-351]EOU17901.1 PRD domain-containing protein [Enterococcus pallens ATCC BAA-351]OJG82476.1 PRD domain-containing protein [Enterococcus pallens]